MASSIMSRAVLQTPIPPAITGNDFARLLFECGFTNPAQAARFFDVPEGTFYFHTRRKDKYINNGKLLAALLICYRDCLNRQIADEQAQLDAQAAVKP